MARRGAHRGQSDDGVRAGRVRARLSDARGRQRSDVPRDVRLSARRGARRPMERSGVRDRVAGRRSADDVAEGSGLAGLREMKRVLVTGANGCIGRHVVPELVARGWDVHAVTSGRASRGRLRADSASADQADAPGEVSEAKAGVTWHTADLLHRGDAEQVVRAVSATHLVHLAWSIVPGRWAEAPENFDWVEASLALGRAFKNHGGARVVTAGSCLEYDWRYGYCSEALTPCTPHTAYGVCKHALQLLTSALARDSSFSSAWARVFFVYGPYEHPDRLV